MLAIILQPNHLQKQNRRLLTCGSRARPYEFPVLNPGPEGWFGFAHLRVSLCQAMRPRRLWPGGCRVHARGHGPRRRGKGGALSLSKGRL